MRKIFSTNGWGLVILGLLVLVSTIFLSNVSTGHAEALYQASDGLVVNVCTDPNADGDCNDPEDSAAPAGVEVCLNNDTNCFPAPHTFTNLASGENTPFLRFSEDSRGYYPTTFRATVDISQTQTITLGAVYPIHPKGIAVHEQTNKVYAAFQGPVVISGTESTKPYPFVAVIDGTSNEVLGTIPGGLDGIGREPWGVATSGNYVYVGSFSEGRVSVINPNTDVVETNLAPDRDDFQPTSPAVNPVTGGVHFPDYRGGRMVIINGAEITAEPLIADQFGFNPFETVVASTLNSYTFATMRDTIFESEANPSPFKLRGFSGLGGGSFDQKEIIVAGENPRHSGPPHALGLWQEEGKEPRLFLTYADDTRLAQNPPDFVNPDKMLVYSFPATEPKDLLLRNEGINIGAYAEVGLVYNAMANHMLGTYAGFAYSDANGDAAACTNAEQGGTYAINYDGGYLTDGADVPGQAWRLPKIAVGNPPLESDDLQWKNPFEIALHPQQWQSVRDRPLLDSRRGRSGGWSGPHL